MSNAPPLPDASVIYGPLGAYVAYDPAKPEWQSWRGCWDWQTTHGQAVVTWSSGKPRKATNVLLPDGSTIPEAVQANPFTPDTWRRPGPDGRWITGNLHIHQDRVTFESSVPKPRRADGFGGLGDQLLADSRLRLLADADDDFAAALYGALCNVTWRSSGENATWKDHWSCTWRTAGGIVADLRSKNEIYLDWYCRGDEGVVRADVGRELARLGWQPVTDVEEQLNHEAAMADMLSWMSRPAGAIPAWSLQFGEDPNAPRTTELPDVGRPISIIHWLARTGRTTQHEHDSLFVRTNLDLTGTNAVPSALRQQFEAALSAATTTTPNTGENP